MEKDDRLVQIIAGCKKGKSEHFSELLDIYANRCYGYFFRLTASRDVSDSLLSELFVKLVEKIRFFKGGSFESWLFKVASNIFYDYLRDKQKQKRLIDAQKKELIAKVSRTKKIDDNIFDELQIQLNNLDEDTKEVIIMRFYSQLSFKEIAQIQDEPIGTTLSKVHRGLKKLRELMED